MEKNLNEANDRKTRPIDAPQNLWMLRSTFEAPIANAQHLDPTLLPPDDDSDYDFDDKDLNQKIYYWFPIITELFIDDK